VAGFEQRFDHVRADVSGTAGKEHCEGLGYVSRVHAFPYLSWSINWLEGLNVSNRAVSNFNRIAQLRCLDYIPSPAENGKNPVFHLTPVFPVDTSGGIQYILKKRYRSKMKEFIRVMKAVSDPTRVKILKILEKRMMCVCELQTALGAAQSTTSKHLKILEDAGLVGSVKDGLWVNYMLADGSQSPYAAALLGNLRHWLNNEPEIGDLVRNIDRIDRFEILNRN
jgi:ArsR family transcriptional regulator